MTLDFKQRHFQIHVWISRDSNLNLPRFKFESPEIQIWISRYSNLNIPIFKFEYVCNFFQYVIYRYSDRNIQIFWLDYTDILAGIYRYCDLMKWLGSQMLCTETHHFEIQVSIWIFRDSNLNLKRLKYQSQEIQFQNSSHIRTSKRS